MHGGTGDGRASEPAAGAVVERDRHDADPPDAAHGHRPSEARGTLTAQAARGLFWAVASFGSNKLVSFIGTLVLARILLPGDFGVVAAGTALLTYLDAGLDLGVASAVVYEQEKGVSRRLHIAFTLTASLGALLAVIGIAAAPLVANVFGAPDQEVVFRLLFLYPLIRGMTQVPDALLQRELDFKRRLGADVTRAAVRVGVAIPLALAGAGPLAIVAGLLAGEIAGGGVTWFVVRFRPRLSFDRQAVTSLLRFGGAVTLVRVLSNFSMNADYLVVGYLLGPAQLGFYSIAYRIPELVIATSYWIVSSVAFPVFSRGRTRGTAKVRSGMLTSVRLTTLFGLPAGLGLALVAQDAITLLFSERWQPAVVPMIVVALALGLGAISNASGDLFPAMGRPVTLVLINLAICIPMVTGFVFAAPLGIAAVAIVHLAGNALYLPLLQSAANRMVHARWREVLASARPGVCAAIGAVLLGLPVRLLLDAGPGRLVATIAAGVAGALAGIAVGGRQVIADVRKVASAAGQR
jgi:lipopolysaccharide exporter